MFDTRTPVSKLVKGSRKKSRLTCLSRFDID